MVLGSGFKVWGFMSGAELRVGAWIPSLRAKVTSKFGSRACTGQSSAIPCLGFSMVFVLMSLLKNNILQELACVLICM